MIFADFNERLYAQYYEDDGTFAGVRKNTTPMTTILKNGHGWQDFLIWNAQQNPPLSLDDIIPPAPVYDTDTQALMDVQDRWRNSPLHNKTPAQIYATMQAQVDGWTSLAQAKADLRVWLPLLFAALAWTVFRNQQRD